MEKALWTQLNIPSWFIVSMEKAWFYERLFFEMVIIIMAKDKKTQHKKTIPPKIS